ncbi:DJ-1/PfpI family protein [Aestuariicella hydrocarbonica]|uniref:DJ-1/PfpI family protein n=1 Tax=Pseudomaricurvus hydrocarbonicus TaxID=1470433 RepID=A0A9E5JTG4_9GAMM|nr:DJ-1/PfpI family protein [Aestuariicella hydrocarbonica]NHO66513.1 DJ-1/PfpI family protein [Aestuariicella hydrocarbonica]
MRVGIYIYDGAEVLDFSGPFEVFSTASRVCSSAHPFEVFLVGESGNVVTARAGYRVIPDYGFHNHPGIDVLLVAGGVHAVEMTKPTVLQWVATQAQQVQVMASVCTGAFLLAAAEVLPLAATGQQVTTHWEDIEDLRKQFPELEVMAGVRWVDEGKVLTSGGISAGIDMSLHLVNRLHSRELAEQTARQMEFVWTGA